MNNYTFLRIITLFMFLLTKIVFAIDPPKIIATGHQAYCAGTSVNIVETVQITFDPLEPTTDVVYIQIASGYILGQDLLSLAASHPTVGSVWTATEGKLRLFSKTGAKLPYNDFEEAIRNVKFSSSSALVAGDRTFSISLGAGQLSYLPRNKHFYEYVAARGITWTEAKLAASRRSYYGLQGYLATLTSLDEAQLTGAQAPGAGWIGASDAETEGYWKWVTGPEAGSLLGFSFWNTGEPNNMGGNENYAHITAPGVGIAGSWNDLSNTGDTSGNYQPKGYVVEYGGMIDGDVDSIQVSASTSVFVPVIVSVLAPAGVCHADTARFEVISSSGVVDWYSSAVGGLPFFTGTSFTTPILTATTHYFVAAGCSNGARTECIALVNVTPAVVATNSGVSRCGEGSVVLEATADLGTINWYDDAVGGNIIGNGNSLEVSVALGSSTFFAEAANNNCVSARTPVVAVAYLLPESSNLEVVKCPSLAVALDAGLSGMTYLWETSGETSQSIVVFDPGIYRVVITSALPQNCSSTKTFTVVEQDAPKIDWVEVVDRKVVIHLTKASPYFEYSIDGIHFQESNTFFDVAAGVLMARVRNSSLCNRDLMESVVLVVPEFFTPNGDSFNDVWEVKGLFDYYPQARLSVFDRYGKLLRALSSGNSFWDGTFNKSPLPAGDYWYVLHSSDSQPERRGHFSLRR